MEFSVRQTVIVAILVLFLGKYLTSKINFLREYNIPEPVSGGLLASILFGILYAVFEMEFDFALEVRDTLLIVFFTGIGLSSKLKTLVQGGKPLVILLCLAIVYLFAQNLTGVSATALSGQPTATGIIAGSVSLAGGHGTAIAWAPRFVEEYGISNAMEFGIACATFGLVLGGLIGGPLGKFLISHYKLEPSGDADLTIGNLHEGTESPIEYQTMLRTLLVLAVSIGTGLTMNAGLAEVGIMLPEFVTCLFAGIIIVNSIPLIATKVYIPDRSRSLALISELSLGLFLAMSLMSLQLWTLGGLGAVILITLVAQVVVTVLFTVFVVFRFMGRDYDAAVISAGFAGLALGATPTAIANMSAVTAKFGASAKAFIVVPLVGAFFIDISNAVIIQFLLDVL
jgi:ESS family glutamate:Na+ symporter